MSTALDVIALFDRHATEGQPPEQFDRDVASVLGRSAGDLPGPDDLRDLALGLLHLSRLFIYQIAQDDGGTPEQVLAGVRGMVDAAPIVEG